MKPSTRHWILLSWLYFCVASVSSQQSYSGLRIAVFDLQLLQQKSQSVALRCKMTNTGRQTLGAKNTSEEIVVEFDTLNYPVLLKGFETAIAEAVRNNCPPLKPGEISTPVWLNVRLPDRKWYGAAGCADVVVDTAYVENWNARSMRIRFFLKNIGSAPAHFYAQKTSPIVNAYFVSGQKLTRGAIPAGTMQIEKGKETIDGMLFPAQILSGIMELNLQDRTKFSPNVALEFDPAQVVDECSRAGNVWVLRLRF